MPVRFSEILKNQADKESSKLAKLVSEGYGIEEMNEQVEVLSNLMRTDGAYKGPKVDMSEALQAADASILFPKVISDVLLRPKEPLMIAQTLLARTIQVDNVRSVEFPTMGALRAFDLAEGQEYPEQIASWTEHLVEIKTQKVGLMVSVDDWLVTQSMWDVFALHVEAAGYAMLRHKEEKIFAEFQAKSHKVFDNSLTDPNAWTNGKAFNQSRNYSVTFDDFIDCMGGLVANEYVPTDIIMHPLAWAVFAKDPILRNVMYTQSQIGQTIWTNKPDFDQQMNVPWGGVMYQVSPFVPLTQHDTLSTGPASGLSACSITDIYVVDRNNSCVVLQADGMTTEEFKDPRRDISNLKVRERYGVGSINGGRASATIANVRLETNYAPTGIYGTVTPS